MKRLIKLSILCSLSVCFFIGCADIAENGMDSEAKEKFVSVDELQREEAVAVTEEGYYVVEGILCEMGKEGILLETEQGQSMYFKLAPETIIYAGGGNSIISEGENIKVVFDGELNEAIMKDISVIAVTVSED